MSVPAIHLLVTRGETLANAAPPTTLKGHRSLRTTTVWHCSPLSPDRLSGASAPAPSVALGSSGRQEVSKH